MGAHSVLARLRELSPTHAVRGNTDGGALGAELPRTEWIEVGACVLYLLHDLDRLDLDAEAAGVTVVVSGKLHVRSVTIDPSLLAGYSAQEQDTSWFVAQLMKRKPGAARRFVQEGFRALMQRCLAKRREDRRWTSGRDQNWLIGDPANGVSPLVDPFPVRANGTRFDTSTKGQLGINTMAGRSYTAPGYATRRAHQHRWRFGVQRQIGKDNVISATYTGSYSRDVNIKNNLNALPAQYWWNGTGFAATSSSWNIVASTANWTYTSPTMNSAFESGKTYLILARGIDLAGNVQEVGFGQNLE